MKLIELGLFLIRISTMEKVQNCVGLLITELTRGDHSVGEVSELDQKPRLPELDWLSY